MTNGLMGRADWKGPQTTIKLPHCPIEVIHPARLPPPAHGRAQQEAMLADNPKVAQANTKFKKLQREEEAKKNLSDYEIDRAAVEVRTARLRAERLAREAELAKTSPPVPAKKKAAKKAKAQSESLSSWLKDQQSSGRNN